MANLTSVPTAAFYPCLLTVQWPSSSIAHDGKLSTCDHEDTSAFADGTHVAPQQPTAEAANDRLYRKFMDGLEKGGHVPSDYQDLMGRLKDDGSARQDALRDVCGRMLAMSFDPKGCWVVQYALAVAQEKDGIELVEKLRTHVLDAVKSRNANFVIEQAVDTLPSNKVSFISEELQGSAIAVACHRSGYRVLGRLLAYDGQRSAAWTDEVLTHARALCRHEWGHFVMQAVLEHGQAEQKRCIAASFLEDVLGFAQDRYACHLVEFILRHCHDQDQRASLDRIVAALGPEVLVALALQESGSRSIRALLDSRAWPHIPWVLHWYASELQTSKYGRRLAKDYNLQG